MKMIRSISIFFFSLLISNFSYAAVFARGDLVLYCNHETADFSHCIGEIGLVTDVQEIPVQEKFVYTYQVAFSKSQGTKIVYILAGEAELANLGKDDKCSENQKRAFQKLRSQVRRSSNAGDHRARIREASQVSGSAERVLTVSSVAREVVAEVLHGSEEGDPLANATRKLVIHHAVHRGAHEAAHQAARVCPLLVPFVGPLACILAQLPEVFHLAHVFHNFHRVCENQVEKDKNK